MPRNTYPLIAREGWLPVTLLVLLLALAIIFLNVTVIVSSGCVLLVLLFLLRDPSRTIATSPLAIVSPVYGTVIAITEVEDEWIARRARLLALNVSPFDIFSLRSPIEGKVVNQWTRKPDGQHSNRQFAFRIRSDEGDEVVVVVNLNIITAALFRFYVHSGERLGHGQRCGFLFLGGRVEVLLPLNSSLRVEAGRKIRSGSGILAQLVHNNGASAIPENNQ